MTKVPIDVLDGSDFTDAEWAEIDRLAEVLEKSGRAGGRYPNDECGRTVL